MTKLQKKIEFISQLHIIIITEKGSLGDSTLLFYSNKLLKLKTEKLLPCLSHDDHSNSITLKEIILGTVMCAVNKFRFWQLV